MIRRHDRPVLIASLKDLRKLVVKCYEGIDPDAIKAPAENKRQLEEAQQLEAGEIEGGRESHRWHVRRGQLDAR